SELTRREMSNWQGKNREPAERVYCLLEKVEFLPDHEVVGFHNQWDRRGGCSYPLVADDPTVRELLDIGLDRTDAQHPMLAIQHGCAYFVTCDERSILKHRATIEGKYPINLVKPSELLPMLTSSDSAPT